MKKHALFLIGEAEYVSQDSMPPFIEEFRNKYGWETTICKSNPIPDGFENYEFEGFDSINGVDVIVIYTRFRVLCKKQMDLLLEYIQQGRPIVAFRTSTHSFQFPESSAYFKWNNDFGRLLFGTPWRHHNGHSSTTDVWFLPEEKDNPILKEVDEQFKVRSWLYYVLPLPATCKPVLFGRSVGSEIADNARDSCDNPVAWTNEYNGCKIFYTSLGHPEDFEVPSFRTLAMNGILWAGGEI